MKKYNIICNGRKIYTDLSLEESSEILEELAVVYYNKNEHFDIELEEIE